MYRLLFLLYIEARPELGYAPMGSEAYRLGYSLEHLRDLEMLELETEEARQGFTLHQWLSRLFEMVYEGIRPARRQEALVDTEGRRRRDLDTDVDEDGEGDGASIHHVFRLEPLKSHLFDPERTPFLNGVKLRNVVLLEVIRSMSLSKPQGTGKGKRRGRISYATLGINQLGAVYEALLSFRGFFAEETLYEVKPADEDRPDPIRDSAFFVPEGELSHYSTKERVFEENGRPRSYPAGTFIYRMAGRDRQQSASYYTPEVLTRSVVKYALKELLEHADGQPRHERAEELLELTLCEPAMGSAAFLNEAVNQLAERYLARRQQEVGERIPHERYAHELQRVRMYLADNNVYGVDLNPVAVELAEVSLWLNAIFTRERGRGREVFVPWFGGQLCTGNSLVGAWRKVFPGSALAAGPQGKESGWLDEVPERVPLGRERPEGSVYHFLLPDRGMAVYGQGNEGKPIREMCAEELGTLEARRKELCRPLSDEDRAALVRLSDAVDRLWNRHVELLAHMRRRTTDPLSVYGHEHPLAGQGPTSTRQKDEIWNREMASEQVRASSPYRRLKMAMDYWCALWFWPIEKAELMPERDEWLADLSMLLDRDVLPRLGNGSAQRALFPPTQPAEEAQRLLDEVGFADVEKLIERHRPVAAGRRAGEALPLPPLGAGVRRRLRQARRLRPDPGEPALGAGGMEGGRHPGRSRSQLHPGEPVGDEDRRATGRSAGAAGNEGSVPRSARGAGRAPGLPGGKGELPGAAGHQGQPLQGVPAGGVDDERTRRGDGTAPSRWDLRRSEGRTDSASCISQGCGVTTQFHQRAVTCSRERIDHGRLIFSLNVYGPAAARTRASSISRTLFHPQTIDECHAHPGTGPVPGIKDDNNDWDTRGHKARIIQVTEQELQLFAQLYDEPDTPAREARLPALHSTELVAALRGVRAGTAALGRPGSQGIPVDRSLQ